MTGTPQTAVSPLTAKTPDSLKVPSVSPHGPSVPAVPDTTSASLGPTVWQFPMTAPPPPAPTTPRASLGGGAARGRRHLGEVGATPRGRGRAMGAAMLGAARAGNMGGVRMRGVCKGGTCVQRAACDTARVCKGYLCVTLHGCARGECACVALHGCALCVRETHTARVCKGWGCV